MELDTRLEVDRLAEFVLDGLDKPVTDVHGKNDPCMFSV